MDETLYPKLNDGGMLNFMEDKVKQVQKDLAHYKKNKSRVVSSKYNAKDLWYFTDKSISGGRSSYGTFKRTYCCSYRFGWCFMV